MYRRGRGTDPGGSVDGFVCCGLSFHGLNSFSAIYVSLFCQNSAPVSPLYVLLLLGAQLLLLVGFLMYCGHTELLGSFPQESIPP